MVETRGGVFGANWGAFDGGGGRAILVFEGF